MARGGKANGNGPELTYSDLVNTHHVDALEAANAIIIVYGKMPDISWLSAGITAAALAANVGRVGKVARGVQVVLHRQGDVVGIAFSRPDRSANREGNSS